MGRLGLAVVALALAPAALTACASRARKPDPVLQLTRRVHALERKQVAAEQRIDDLGNQVFLLEDKLETVQVAAQRAPQATLRLPVVRLQPGSGEEAASDPQEGADDGGSSDAAIEATQDDPSSTLVATDEVRYRGAARSDGGRNRPVLRLSGEAPIRAMSMTSANVSARSKTSAPIAVQEKLPVAPLANKRVAKDLAEASHGDGAALKLYREAMVQFHEKHYPKAMALFRTFLKRFPRHAYADNALYWLAEAYYDQKKFSDAARVFGRVLQEHPNGNKAPDALLKLGYSYLSMRDKDRARKILTQVAELYPKSKVAELAGRKLASLR